MSNEDRDNVDATGRRYSSVDLEDDEKLSFLEAKQLLDFQLQQKKSARRLRLSILLNILVLLALIGTYVVWLGDGWPFTMNLALRRLNMPSPLLDQFKFHYHDDRINGTIWNENAAIYRMPPSPEVDAAWGRLSGIKVFPVTRSDLSKIGRDPLEAAQVPPEWGYGDDIYPAYLDVQHQIHCLNEIRMYAYWSHYYAPRYGNDTTIFDAPALHRYHLSHCLYILLQDLQCRPSASVDTFAFISKTHPANVDVRIKKKCASHEALLQWQEDNHFLTDSQMKSIKPRPDQKYVLPPDGVDPGLDL